MPVPPPYPHERRKGTILKEALLGNSTNKSTEQLPSQTSASRSEELTSSRHHGLRADLF